MKKLADVYLNAQADRRLRAGHVWVYSNEIDGTRSPLRNFEPGQAVNIWSYRQECLGSGYINPHSLISVRRISKEPDQVLTVALLLQRLRSALTLRERLFKQPYYRWVYGEADGLPGLVIDRFGEVLAVQLTTAGMENLRALLLEALEQIMPECCIVLRNNSSIRQLENLPMYTEVARGVLPAEVLIEENGVRFSVEVLTGQKTGWFYDHRLNRQRFLSYVSGKRVLDLFSYTGAWGIQAAKGGASSVCCVDSSVPALEKVSYHAQLNGVSSQVNTLKGDAFEVLKMLKQDKQEFEVIVLDPPAFIKRKKDQGAGEIAYRRINQLAMALLSAEGILISASCSLPLSATNLLSIVNAASLATHHSLQVVEQGHQGPDHPIHPAIPETAYLKSLTCAVYRQ